MSTPRGVRRMRFRLAAAASMAVAALCGAIPAALPAPNAAKPIPIRIGFPGAHYWPLFLARDLGLFEQVGLNPKFYTFTTGAPLIAGMKSESLDVAWTGLATLFMLEQGIPLKFVLVPLSSSSQMSFIVNPASGIASYKDLHKANAIGIAASTCMEVSMVMAAKAVGIPAASLRVVPVAPEKLLSAFKSGAIDSTFVWGPWNIELRNAGYRIASSDRDFMPNGGVCGVTVAIRPAFLEQHPSVGCKMVKIHAMALEAAARDPERAIQSLQKALGISHDVAKETYETLEIPSLKSQLEPMGPWSLSATREGLAGKLFIASEALHRDKPYDAEKMRQTIARSTDARYIKQYLETDCR